MNIHTVIATALLALFLCGVASAEVYKRTNPDGSVEFTDVPSKQKEEAVPLSPMSTFKAPVKSLPKSRSSKPAQDTPSYKSLTITSPENDAAIRENAGNVSISVSLNPALQAKHTLLVQMDGQTLELSAAGTIELSNIDRGSHTITAQVLDENDEEIISAEPVIFHLQRFSAIKR